MLQNTWEFSQIFKINEIKVFKPSVNAPEENVELNNFYKKLLQEYAHFC